MNIFHSFSSSFLVLVVYCYLYTTSQVQAADTAAQAKCRALHHVDVDASTTYGNSQCLLNCVIHGTSTVHYMNEGLNCPLASNGVSVE